MADQHASSPTTRATPAPIPAEHDHHDLLRVAEAADRGGRLPPELAACPACVALHAELGALAAALPGAALPARPRDFRLTPADAARLRGWRRWWDAIGTSRDVLTRPLAIGLTTLGLAGLLVSAVPSVLPMGGAASGPAPTTEAPAEAPALGAPATGAPSDGRILAAPGATATDTEGGDPVGQGGAVADVDPLAMIAVASLASGLIVFGIRAARR